MYGLAMAELTPAREQKLNEVYTCVSRAGEAGASVSDVATCLNMKISPHVRALLDQLVELRALRKESGVVQTPRGLRTGWRYFVVPEGE